MKTTRPATAAEVYAARQTEIATLIAELQARLATHAEHATKHPENWGYAGDLGHAVDALKNILPAVRRTK